jgi:predicted metal-binding membrane protein
MAAAILARVLHHERALPVVAVALVTAMAWAYLFTGAGTMENMDGMLMPMSAGPWTVAHARVMVCMWIVMMVAMMLPSALPMLLLYATIARRQHGAARAAPAVTLFALAYLAVWSLFSIAAAALQYLLERAALLSPMMESTSIVLAGATLVAAGVYQWTPVKSACLAHCQSPLDFVLAHWHSGSVGAFRMGIRHGAYCVGCCWALMLLLFVGGVMNLAWIAGLAVYVLVEKLTPPGHWISRATGVVFVAWGVATLLSPYLASNLA